MATTSPDNIRTPDAGDSYALVQDLGILADTTQNALIKRANAYVGTVSQRNANTDLPVGTIWSDSDAGRDVWKKGASEWEPLVFSRSDSSWTSLPGSVLGGNTVVRAEYRVVSDWVFISISLTGSFPEGSTDIWQNLSGFLLPSENVHDTGYFSGGSPGSVFIRPTGTIAAVHKTGTTRSTVQCNIRYPLEV